MRRVAAFALSLMLIPAIAWSEMSKTCGAPADRRDGWAVAAPEREGFDPALICSIASRLDGWEEANPHGVVIVRNGKLVYEHYFAGKDWRLSMSLGVVNFDAGTKHDIRSISKSVTSLLVGIALDRGLITDLDAPVFSFFPEYADLRTPEKDRMTLRHLLTMSSGLAWNETSVAYTNPSNTYWQMGIAPRADYFVLAQPLAAPPGTVFNYNTGAVDLLGIILRKVSGKRLDEFAKEALFDPLGIEDWEWEGSSGFNPSAASGLRLRPRDLAKIGQLVLDRGKWRGQQQIVSSSWIEASTTPRLTGKGAMFDRPAEGLFSYGYLWWLAFAPPEHPERNMIVGAGNGGQRLFIVPSLGLVVVTTAGVYGGESSGLTGTTVLKEYALPGTVGH